MGRTDVRALSVPELPPVMVEPAAEIDMAAREQSLAVPQPMPAAAAAKPDNCPHCRSKLSDLDVKFDRCLACGKPLGGQQAPASFRVGI